LTGNVIQEAMPRTWLSPSAVCVPTFT